jgi:hypothetical protein
MASLAHCCKAVADIQLHCLAGTGSSSVYYAAQMRFVVNHSCSNLFSSSIHVIGELQRLKLGTVVCSCMHCNHQNLFSSAYWQGGSDQARQC